jgi:hypothetical protein
MITRVIGLLAVVLATGCAFEQAQEGESSAAPVAPTSTAQAAIAPQQTPERIDTLAAPPDVAPVNGIAIPCDPDPQPWRPRCGGGGGLGGGGGGGIARTAYVPPGQGE